ncbi:DUF4231 domain-containing protein [Streptomyces sp. NPDC058045]|uniref:DUF4231 domain-containing protein n=1 Tax=Streptomyces sp. NPDC058045 TaxID=3346311 RepID=UPI0036ECF78B
MPTTSEDALLAQALADLDWYARTRDRARRWHRATELGALLVGAATIITAGVRAPAYLTATLAGVAVLIGGFRQVFNHTERYVLAAEAWMRLRQAIRRYELLPEAERDEEARRRLLDAVEATADSELRGWAAYQRGPAASYRSDPAAVPGEGAGQV